jgi:hypothetical protein
MTSKGKALAVIGSLTIAALISTIGFTVGIATLPYDSNGNVIPNNSLSLGFGFSISALVALLIAFIILLIVYSVSKRNEPKKENVTPITINPASIANMEKEATDSNEKYLFKALDDQPNTVSQYRSFIWFTYKGQLITFLILGIVCLAAGIAFTIIKSTAENLIESIAILISGVFLLGIVLYFLLLFPIIISKRGHAESQSEIDIATDHFIIKQRNGINSPQVITSVFVIQYSDIYSAKETEDSFFFKSKAKHQKKVISYISKITGLDKNAIAFLSKLVVSIRTKKPLKIVSNPLDIKPPIYKEPLVCPKCHQLNEPGTKYCSHCGFEFKE